MENMFLVYILYLTPLGVDSKGVHSICMGVSASPQNLHVKFVVALILGEGGGVYYVVFRLFVYCFMGGQIRLYWPYTGSPIRLGHNWNAFVTKEI